MSRTKIEWCARPGTVPESWSPVTGCSPVSEGCRHCWAERMARRLAGRYGYPEMPRHFDVTLRPDRLEEPLRWKRKPRTVFVCAMGDLFHKDVSWVFRSHIFSVMAMCQQHTFLILTKRAREMFDWFTHPAVKNRQYPMEGSLAAMQVGKTFTLPLPNVHLGVTAENQTTADERIPLLLQVPAAVRFVSCEPLLERVRIKRRYLSQYWAIHQGVGSKLDWLIAGGESGPGARPLHPGWARDLRDQCQTADIPYFHKQNGAWLHESQFTDDQLLAQILKTEFGSKNADKSFRWPDDSWSYRVGKKAAGRLLDGREWNEFPG